MLIEPSRFSLFFAERKKDSHKGNYGHVVIFAGSLGHLGAGYLSSLAALRAGAGLVTYCLPEKAFTRFDARYPEIMCEIIPDVGSSHFHPDGLKKAFEVIENKSAIAIGPAIGTEKVTREFVNSFLAKADLPVVIDADALNVLDIKTVKQRRSLTILTPHPGEMARLQNTTTDKIEANRIESATRLAKESGAIVILKGHGTIVATKDGVASINPTGNAGMATAGMGDALTGMIAAFIAQGMDGYTASCAAVYFHGLAGDLAARERTERALITSDLIGKLGEAFKLLSS